MTRLEQCKRWALVYFPKREDSELIEDPKGGGLIDRPLALAAATLDLTEAE